MTDPRRTQIVQNALAEIGPGDVARYMVACGLPADTHADWCGIFCLAMIKSAGVAHDVIWISGIGFAYPQHLTITRTPQPGDIYYKDQPHQHYGLVVDHDPVTGKLVAVEGNTPTVQRLEHDHPTGVVYFSIDKLLDAPTPQPTPMPDTLLRGIDVSKYQDPARVDYVKLAQTHRFVFARATYGTHADDAFAEHVHHAQGAGLVVGAYHFYRPSLPVADQLTAFLSVVRPLGMGDQDGWLPPAIDLEKDGTDFVSTDHYAPAEQLTACFREQFGAALVYLSPSFWTEIGHPAWIKQHLLWVAHWDVQHPTTPDGVPWTLWQHRVAPLPGILPGQVDQDYAHSLPLLRAHDPAAPLLLAIDWDELRAERDAVVQEEA